ncbi:prohibitin family protein [Deinococcus cellulosilyticus]|uniref:Band 7 domain-containing protein n=1 Tax=Deinococcus cellulosilyticus (strain DSM 18568 / NBRC 106333 / KACC 11606 / 5516J-15) TaxID=1223518 RepID=A0A511MZ21_DEIC1|nr:prohibitin family protein [Deinococcus cellulosilyticus]GEM45792.1 hypothetical protein DC3_14270 [Deinococcus cellulosilyticus NBRC 106333 = KACC 11606]
MPIFVLVILAGIVLLVLSANQKQKAFRTPAIALVAVGLLGTALSGAFVIIPAGSVGVVFNIFGGVKPGVMGEGYHFVLPGVERVTIYEARLQEITLSRIGESGQNTDESIHARSKEGLEIAADITVQFSLKADEAAKMHKELGPHYIDTVIRPQVRSKVRDAVGQFNAADLISTQRTQLEALITERLTSEFDKNHIELRNVLLRELRIPESVAKVIEEKQTAEQQVAIEKNRKQQSEISAQRKVIEAEGDAKAQIARAEGEAKALSLRGKALKENPEIIQLTMAEKLAPSIQTIMVPSNGGYLLDLKSLTTAKKQ